MSFYSSFYYTQFSIRDGLLFDDIDISKYMGLSSVSQSLDESGKMAAECVLNRLRNGGKSNFSVMVPINVVERKTT